MTSRGIRLCALDSGNPGSCQREKNARERYGTGIPDTEVIDSVDYAIIELLVQDARRTIAEIAERVSLSPSPVKRRIDRLANGSGSSPATPP